MNMQAIEVSKQQPIEMPLPLATDIVVIARNREEMRASQDKLCEWAAAKVAESEKKRAELCDLREAARCAKQAIRGYGPLIRDAADSVLFYAKIRAALKAGYCIVPNFPVDVIAVRIDEDRAAECEPDVWHESVYRQTPRLHDASPDKLAPGLGHYVDPLPRGTTCSEKIERPGEKPTTRYTTTPLAWRDVAFPAKLARRELIENLTTATKQRVFDDIGILPERRKRHADPMLIGRIHSRPGHWATRTVSFLIAWWIDTETL